MPYRSLLRSWLGRCRRNGRPGAPGAPGAAEAFAPDEGRARLGRRAVLKGGAALFAAGCQRHDRTVEKFSRHRTEFACLSPEPATGTQPFKLKYAPHFGMFKANAGRDYVDQLEFAAAQGFRAWEDNIIHWRSPGEQERIAGAMADLGLEMGVFIGADAARFRGGDLTAGDPGAVERFLDEVTQSIATAKLVRAKWITVITGRRHFQLRDEYQIANLIDVMRRAADIVEPHGLVLALEPLNSRFISPPPFPDAVSAGFLICRAVDSPSCKLLWDSYHAQIMSGDLLGDLERSWDQVAYIQVADHPGRNEPMTGEINYVGIFQFLRNKGYDGVIGMEHGVNGEGAEGELRMIDRYRYCDSCLI